jgi:hypothetical protein
MSRRPRNGPAGLAQAPEPRGAIVLYRGAIDADISEHPVVEAREQLSIADARIPGQDAFDQSNQRAAETGAKTGSTARWLKRSLMATCTQSQGRRRWLPWQCTPIPGVSP